MDFRIDHVHAVAVDLDTSIDFYTGVLGFDLLRRVEFGADDARKELAYISKGDTPIELVQPREANDPLGGSGTGSWPFALTVDDMAAAESELEGKGVEVVVPSHPCFSFKGLAATIKHPSGLAIELREWQDDSRHNPDWQPERAYVVRTA
jgi:lactoylglutathione lyase